MYCCDNLLITVPAKVFLTERLREGEFPFWNPMILSGMPYLADINLGTLYPSTLLYLFYNPIVVVTVVSLLHYLLAFAGMYKFIRTLYLTPQTAITAATIYTFSGSLITYSNNTAILQVAAMFPWLMWAWRRLAVKKTPGSLFAVAVVSALTIVAGHVQVAYYSLIFGILFFVITGKGTLLHKAGLVILAVIPALDISALQIIPFAEFAGESTRIGNGWDYASYGSLPPVSLIRFLLPSIAGNIPSGTDWVFGGTVSGFTGVLTLYFALYGIGQSKVQKFFLYGAILSLVLALGRFTPFYAIVYSVVPGISLFRMPSQILIVWTLSIAVLAGFGVNRHTKDIKVPLTISAYMAFGSITAALAVPFLTYNVLRISAQNALFASKITFLGYEGTDYLITNILLNICILGIGFMILRVIRQLITDHSAAVTGITVLIFLELFLYSGATLATVPYSKFKEWTEPTLTVLPVNSWQTERLYIDPSSYKSPVVREFSEGWLPGEIRWQIETLRPNLAGLKGIATVNGYSSSILRRLADAVSESRQPDPTGIEIDSVRSDIFHTLASTKILTRDTSMYTDGFTKKGSLSDLTVYENKDARPRFFGLTADQSTISAEVSHYSANTAEISIDMPQDGVAVFSDMYYPGWTAKVDNVPTRIMPYGNAVKSVAVPAGHHVISFSFRPRYLMVAFALTIAGLFLLGVYWVYADKYITFSKPAGGNKPLQKHLSRR